MSNASHAFFTNPDQQAYLSPFCETLTAQPPQAAAAEPQLAGAEHTTRR
jgi:hypothetical protein